MRFQSNIPSGEVIRHEVPDAKRRSYYIRATATQPTEVTLMKGIGEGLEKYVLKPSDKYHDDVVVTGCIDSFTFIGGRNDCFISIEENF